MSSQSASETITVQAPTAFDSEDLRYLRRLLDEMLDDLRRVNETVNGLGDGNRKTTAPLANDQIEIRLAAALFDCAKPGRRDDFRLKRIALEKVATLVSKRL